MIGVQGFVNERYQLGNGPLIRIGYDFRCQRIVVQVNYRGSGQLTSSPTLRGAVHHGVARRFGGILILIFLGQARVSYFRRPHPFGSFGVVFLRRSFFRRGPFRLGKYR